MFPLAHFMKELGFELATYNFSEASHGKSTADGVGVTADNYVKYGSDIASINEFIEAFDKKNGKIKIFVINDSEINEIDTKASALNLSRIPGTLKLHQVAIYAPNWKLLNLRHLSCLDCQNSFECRHYDHGPDFDISVSEAKINASVPKESKAANSIEEYNVPESEIQFGKWVAVIYDEQWFLGVIKKIDSKEDHIRFIYVKV